MKMAFGALAALIVLGGCSQIRAWRHPEFAACEDYVLSTLKSPSSYRLSKATISDSRLPAAYWNEQVVTAPVSIRPLLRDVNKKYALEGGRRLVLVEYDADNAFGTPLRGLASCTFEMSSIANNEFTSTPSASSSKLDAALVAAGIRNDSEGCCESKQTMKRLEKYEPQAEYVSQQVIN